MINNENAYFDKEKGMKSLTYLIYKTIIYNNLNKTKLIEGIKDINIDYFETF